MATSPTPKIHRRHFLTTTGAAGASLGLAACAPSAPETPPASSETAKAGWEQQWADLAAAAKKEGSLVLMCSPAATGYDKAAQEFSTAFPGIETDLRSFPGVADYGPKLSQERQAGIHAFDVALIPTAPEVQDLINAGVFDPIRPLIFRPDVLDDRSWIEGFERGFSGPQTVDESRPALPGQPSIHDQYRSGQRRRDQDHPGHP